MRQITSSAITSGLLLSMTLAGQASAAERSFKCSSRNDRCVIADRSFVTGDTVGFFTDRGELIATGEVVRMQGAQRSVQLQQVMGSVSSKAHSYAALDNPSAIQQQMRIYKQPSPMAIAVTAGLATFGAGSDAAGYEISGEGIRTKFLGKVDGFARGSLYSFSGTARNVYADTDPGSFKATSFAALGGVGYTLFSQNDFLLRTELGLGLAYTVAKINNSIADAKSEDWGYRVNSGFAPHGRAMLAAGYRFDGWQVEASVSPAILAGKSATSIGAGLLINMK